MKLSKVEVVDSNQSEVFCKEYLEPLKPVIIKNLATKWPAFQKWNWDYFKKLVGNQQVGIFNNIKSDAFTPINTADDYTTFGEYIDKVRNGPAEWRIFLFNIFDHAPQITNDFNWPDHLMKGFVKKYPMLFVGGQGSITHMHFDIDMSNILHTQFCGRKRVLLFPFNEQHKLYRKPWEVLSLVDFSHYSDPDISKIDYNAFPALRHAVGYDMILEPGDTLFMPAGYWHHMEYIDSGFALSLRAMQPSISGKLRGVWNLFGMRSIDTVLKKTAPHWWYKYKKEKIFEAAEKINASFSCVYFYCFLFVT